MSKASQKPGGGQSRRPCSDNGDFMSCVRKAYRFIGFHLEGVPIGDKTFDAIDVDRAVQGVAAAIRFAWMGANASADSGKRITFFNHGERFQKVAAMDMVDILLNVNMRRAS